MTERMYSERVGNISAFRGCGFGCTYCAFKRLIQMNKKCPQCATFEPHFHPEALERKPPKTKEGEFLTIGLASDISFMPWNEFERVLNYCHKWKDRTFLIQSKDPEFFTKHFINCDNVIIGTTIESDCWWWDDPKLKINIRYDQISKAPFPAKRYEPMRVLNCRKAVTIEPILSFNLDTFSRMLINLRPKIVWVGYDSGNNKLPEPSLQKTRQLIDDLRAHGLDVHEKLLRKAWWELM